MGVAEAVMIGNGMARALFGGYFQQGYVTNDMDAALAFYRDRLGVGKFHVFDTKIMSSDPEGPQDSPLLIGLAWCGHAMIELIQPVEETPPLYAGLLPEAGFAIRFHHHGYLTYSAEEWAEQRRAVMAAGMPIVVEKARKGLSYFYADARPQLGHHVEFILCHEEGRPFFDAVPRND